MSRNLTKEIQSIIDNADVVLFMKGDADMPLCGFSAAVVQVLTQMGVPFQAVNVLEDEEIRQTIKEFSDWPTIPQLYVKREFIGGCDIVREMYMNGELQSLFSEKNIKTAA
ncbi:MAG: Grx4 family monothiol glutaredoxin [Rhodospirillales bacterium]|nr:Grx4 family monothiol glutaredoxin [Rhodospirillales bacterium]MCB9965032.1 Grx4 family monothiol glutaredoxin [Rhodospirillales bacterium]MCB9980360.1 Grx4 family monothiol glutaredoxin [Rhodospirillales bacterium]